MKAKYRKAQAENRRWKYFSDPEYRAGRLAESRRYFKLWQNNAIYREYISLGRVIWRRRNSIQTHLRIVERYRKELRGLEQTLKRLEAKRAAEKAALPRGKVATAGGAG